MKAAAPTLKERGIAKPSNKPKKAAAKLSGTHAAKLNGTSKPLIGEWVALVDFANAVTTPAFAHLTMTYLWMIHKKLEVPPAKGSPSDLAIDDFAQSLASMIFNLFVEIGKPTDQELWQKLRGGTVLECLGPRPQPYPNKSSTRPVYPQQRRPLQVHELEIEEEEFQKWLVERQAREGAAT